MNNKALTFSSPGKQLVLFSLALDISGLSGKQNELFSSGPDIKRIIFGHLHCTVHGCNPDCNA